MIDRDARNILAEKLRQLASGAITNFHFEARGRRSRHDVAVQEIADCLAWPHYDDFSEHRLEGDYALSDGRRKDFARAVLFLKSDYEYRWPVRSGPVAWVESVRRAFTLGACRPPSTGGDARIWPFWTEEEYRAALKRHPYLRGDDAQG